MVKHQLMYRAETNINIREYSLVLVVCVKKFSNKYALYNAMGYPFIEDLPIKVIKCSSIKRLNLKTNKNVVVSELIT